ncbi:MAG: 50S ribosomal protein L4 [Bacteroidales bacterium]|nr:50S ribosomal protein L4 [Bacteroidales bacterium]MDD4575921.1 50S ribosomal protein L4 [Bacteroidales bacterium]MDY0216646.1 50S ribosomal protein L4 [Bacteroidales bacterium]
MELKVFKFDGSETAKSVSLMDEMFAIEPNDHAMWLDVKQLLANRRQGTHCTKEKSTLSGSTRKIKKQKGTGGARAGSIKNPLFRGGARIFGPQPRLYGFKLNKKVKQLARYSALSYKAKNQDLIVVEDFTFDQPKTKNYSEFLSNFDLVDKKTLLIVSESNKNVYLSSRNLKGSNVVSVTDINTYDIMNASKLIFFESSLEKLQNTQVSE